MLPLASQQARIGFNAENGVTIASFMLMVK
jgi:hypothetical protein